MLNDSQSHDGESIRKHQLPLQRPELLQHLQELRYTFKRLNTLVHCLKREDLWAANKVELLHHLGMHDALFWTTGSVDLHLPVTIVNRDLDHL